MTIPAPVLTPHGALILGPAGEALALAPGREERLAQAFHAGPATASLAWVRGRSALRCPRSSPIGASSAPVT